MPGLLIVPGRAGTTTSVATIRTIRGMKCPSCCQKPIRSFDSSPWNARLKRPHAAARSGRSNYDRDMSVFPLPSNAFEHYMLADDSADYPRLFWLVVKVRGTLDRDRFAQAVKAATRRHPLLRALVEYEGDRPRRWIECREPNYTIRWHEGTSQGRCGREYVIEPIDLRREPGVRFQIWNDGAGDVIGVAFHHATTDGIGAIQFVRDLLALYGSDSDGAAAKSPPLEMSPLATRNSFGLTGWRRPLRWLYGTFGWLGAIEYLSHRPVPLGRMSDRAGSERRGSEFCSRILSSEETGALVQAAKRAGATLNDRLIRDVFLATQAFIERHSPERSGDHQRIMVPVNLRSASDELLPAANVVAMINIDRRPQHWTDVNRVVAALN